MVKGKQHTPLFGKRGKESMAKLYQLIVALSHNERAQDIVEYALLAGFITVAAGALLPPVADGISVIFSKMKSLVNNVAAQ